jgi:Phage tail tube protein
MGYAPFQKLAIEASHLIPSALTTRVEFQPGSTLGLKEDFLDANGLRGTLSRDISRVMIERRAVGGKLIFAPNTAELRNFLPWMLWGAEGGGGPYTYALSDTPIPKWATVDRVTDRAEYTNLVPTKWKLHAVKGKALTIEMDLIGMDEAKSSTAFLVTLFPDGATGPFVLSNLVLDIAGNPYYLPEFDLNADFAIDLERFYNSPTLTAVNPTDRKISMDLETPYAAAAALYGLVGTSGTATVLSTAAAVVATFTNGVNILTLTMANCAWPRESPLAKDRGEIMLPIHLNAYANHTTPTVEISASLAVS